MTEEYQRHPPGGDILAPATAAEIRKNDHQEGGDSARESVLTRAPPDVLSIVFSMKEFHD